jgi:hypothetical protein
MILQIVENSFGQRITFPVVDADGVPVPLTGNDVYFTMWPEGSPAKVMVNVACVIDVPDTQCYYDVLTGDFDTAGKFKGLIYWTCVAPPLNEKTIPFDVEILEAP